MAMRGWRSFKSSRLLGMMVLPQSIRLSLAADGSAQGVREEVFTFPEGLSWDKPQALGQALAVFLKKKQLGVRQVVVALPGKWTLFKARTLPPCNAQAAAAVLRLAVEREYQGNARDWSFDYVVQNTTESGTNVLLAAVPQNRLVQLKQMAQAAGLTLEAVVPASATVAMSTPQPSQDSATLYVTEQGYELAVWKQGRLVAVEHLVAAGASGLETPVSRALAMHGVNVASVSVDDLRAPSSESSTSSSSLQTQLGRLAGELVQRAQPLSAQVAAAWGRQPQGVLNPLHSRLEVKAASRFTRLHAIGAVIAAIVLLFAGFLAVDWFTLWRDTQQLQAQLADVKPVFNSAKARVNRYELARGWYDKRPGMLDGMMALTMAFPTDGSVWSSSLIMRDDMTGTLAGKAISERAAIELIERLRATAGFKDVKMLYFRQADRTSTVVSFALNFSYERKD